MKYFFFIIFIPVVASVITAILGIGWMDGNVPLAAAINLPICLLSSYCNSIID